MKGSIDRLVWLGLVLQEALHYPYLHQRGGQQQEYLSDAQPLDVGLCLFQHLAVHDVPLRLELLVTVALLQRRLQLVEFGVHLFELALADESLDRI